MSVTVRVYGDEAGTMPVRDEDDIFIAATFALVGDVPGTLPDKRSTAQWTATHLSALKAQSVCALVKPYTGFGIALAKKMDGMNFMAQKTKTKTGLNSQYVPEGGFTARNMIWGYQEKASSWRERLESIREESKRLEIGHVEIVDEAVRVLDLAQRAYTLYMKQDDNFERRKLIEIFSSRVAISGDRVLSNWLEPFKTASKLAKEAG